MDTKERSLKLLGGFGIVGETFKIIRSQAKLLGTITLALILPCVFITLIQILISPLLFSEIFPDESDQWWTVTILESTEFAVVQVLWALLFYVGLMPSIAAVVYTVAGVYKGEQGNSIASVMRPVPAVWKRMLITCLWYFIINFMIIVACAFLLFLALIIPFGFYVLPPIIVLVFVGVYLYVRMLWQVATVVSVMEEGSYGWEGMKKSRSLINGKRTTAWGLTISYMVVVVLFSYGAILGNFYFVGLWGKIFYGTLYLVLACVITVMWEVTQSMLYLVCKSHHGDSIDEGRSLEGCPEIARAGGNGTLESNNDNMGWQNWLTS